MPYKDKSKQLAASRRWLAADKGRYKMWVKAQTIARKERAHKYVTDWLATHPCVDCGESDPIVLDFDHVKPILKGRVSTLRHKASSLKTLQKEIDQCEVRCCNCHRRVTVARRALH